MRIVRRSVLVLLIGTMLATGATGTALANRKHNQGAGNGSFSLVLLNSAGDVPHWGDNVTFTVSTTVSQPWVQLTCDQNGTKVLNQYIGFYAGYPWSQVFSLGTWMWTSGAADCNARLFDGSNNATLATMSFHVGA